MPTEPQAPDPEPEETAPLDIERWYLESLAVHPKHPVYAAILHRIETELDDALADVASVHTAKEHGLLAHAAGRLAALYNLKTDLKTIRTRAMSGKEEA